MNGQIPLNWRDPAWRQARLLQLQAWWREHMGWHGALAALLLVLSLLSVCWLRPSLQATLRGHQQKVVAQQAQARQLALLAQAAAPYQEPHEAWLEALPSARKRGESVARLLHLLSRAGVSADSADYVARDQEPGLTRLQVTVPIQGNYLATRKLVAVVLNGMPHAALDSLQLDQQLDDGTTLTGQLRMSLFFRREAP